MASYKNGSITLENVYGKKTYETTMVECGSSTELQELIITENGIYEAPKGTGYSPVKVNVPQTAESGTLKAVLDTTKSAAYLFYGYKGTSVDNLIKFSDTSNVTNVSNIFGECHNLTNSPQLDISNATDSSSMYRNCFNIISIPQLDTSNVTDMSHMFTSCYKLTSIPQLDTSNVTNMPAMFISCYKLTSIPQLDTSNVTDMNNMFYSCKELTSIPELDASKCTNFNYIFGACSSLTSIGMYGFTRSIAISSTALEHDAIVAFLNQAGTAYNSSQKITMGSTKLALLSDEEKAIATNKGWTLA